MGLRVNTNIYSLSAQTNLAEVSSRLGSNFARLSSGLRIASASDDAAGLGISERMRAQIRSLEQAERNASDGISLVQTAEGTLNELNGNLVRMRELAIQASNGTLNSGDRAVIDVEFQQLIEEIDRVANQSTFNGIALFDGTTGTLAFQVGVESGETIEVTLQDLSSATLGLGIDVTTATNAQASLDVIDTAVDSVTTLRGDLGAAQNRLGSTVRSIANASENLSAAESRIRDVDVAAETADLTRNSILQQAAVSVLAQANVQPQIALSLLQG
jgi:flagellin